MKDRLLIFLIASFFILNTAIPLSAQMVKIGGGYSYASGINASGLNIRGQYLYSYNFSLGAEMNYFFAPSFAGISKNESRTQLTELQLNARYSYYLNDKLFVYPVVGILWFRKVEQFPGLNEGVKKVDFQPGLNTGIGISWQKGKLAPFAEYRYTWGLINQSVFTVGLSIKELWKHE